MKRFFVISLFTLVCFLSTSVVAESVSDLLVFLNTESIIQKYSHPIKMVDLKDGTGIEFKYTENGTIFFRLRYMEDRRFFMTNRTFENTSLHGGELQLEFSRYPHSLNTSSTVGNPKLEF